MRIVEILFCLSLLYACQEAPKNDTQEMFEDTTSSKQNSEESEYTILATQEDKTGWGYQILKDGKIMIDQKIIPAIQGNSKFSTKEAAIKTANYMVEKIQKGHFPPTISVEELDSLKVLF